MNRIPIYILLHFLAALVAQSAYGQVIETGIRQTLQEAYWTKISLPSDSSKDYASALVSDVYSFYALSFQSDLQCEIVTRHYVLIDDPISGGRRWTLMNCNPNIKIHLRAYDSSFTAVHNSEQGRYRGTFAISKSRILFIGKSDDGVELREEYIRVPLPDSLAPIIKR